jgi:hypothetical protein
MQPLWWRDIYFGLGGYMIINYTINGNTWTVLNTAGQSGSVFIAEDDVNVSPIDVRVMHTTGTPVSGDFAKAKRVYKSLGNNDVLSCSADSSTDVYYAKCRNTDDSVILSADFI